MSEREPSTLAGDGGSDAALLQGELPPLSAGEPTRFRSLRAKGRMAIPIAVGGWPSSQDIVVRPKGTRVKRGENLLEQAPPAAPIPLAPADGRVVGIGAARLSARSTTPAILFEADEDAHAAAPAAPLVGPEDIRHMLQRLRQMTLEQAVVQLRGHGVWADRWTSPDLLGQLRAAQGKAIDTVLCNGLDESPELLLYNEVAGAFSMELTAGVLALATLTKAKQVWAVMAAYGDPAVWEALRYAAAGTDLRLVPLRDHYPQAHPSLLIHELTGRHTRITRLPTEVGVLSLDAPAAVAVGQCFLFDQPMLTVPAAVYDKARGAAHWLSVPVGMPWSQVLCQLSIDESGIGLRAGNPLREIRLGSDCVVAGGELSATVAPQDAPNNADPCIRCAWCVEGCPVHIQPAGLLEAAQLDDPYLGDQYGLDACIECGICSYVCPSQLPILGGIRALRKSNARGRELER